MNSTRHVVQRALPPRACSTSTCASCSIASTRRFPSSTSTVPKPSTVNFAIVLDSPCPPSHHTGSKECQGASGAGVPGVPMVPRVPGCQGCQGCQACQGCQG